MCGIAVIFGKRLSFDECKAAIQGMAQAAAHRGPNDEGVAIFQENGDQPLIFFGLDTPKEAGSSPYPYCKPTKNISYKLSVAAAIGHRRLSILDLSIAGHQPMCSQDGRYWITYNGEIYNHVEIRSELEVKGYFFQTKTDTEVILYAYACWGVDCLHKFNGMFAFAIVDSYRNTIFAARDRFGVKPLYLWESPRGTIALASEIKQFAVLPDWEASLDHQQAYDFLNWGVTDHREETFFRGVKQLLPGHYIQCELQEKPRPKKWYSIPQEPLDYSFGEASSLFHDLFFDAVRVRLRADVEVGSCLSGGLDSSSIVCAVERLLDKNSGDSKQSAFSACSHEKEVDEREYVEALAKGRRLNMHYIYPSFEELRDNISDLVKVQDEPFGSTSIYAQWSIFKHVKRQGISVMLDGQGADEQLAGYHSFFGYRMLEQFKRLQWVDLFHQAQHMKKAHRDISPYMMLVNRLLPDLLRDPVYRMVGRVQCVPHWLNKKKLHADFTNPLQGISIRSVNDWGRVLTTTSNLPMLLRYEDRNSMAHSIESRTPFLDYRLVEFCLNISSDHKLQGAHTKQILRHSMSPYLPKKIVNRLDKMAFLTAEEKWMKSHSDYFRRLLKESVEQSHGIVKPEILHDFERMVEGRIPFSYLFWRVISFGLWIKSYGSQY